MTFSKGRMTPLDPSAAWGGDAPLTATAAGVARRRWGENGAETLGAARWGME